MTSTFPAPTGQITTTSVKAVLVVHGGAGTILRENLTPQLEAEHLEALEAALRAGYAALQAPDGSALDSVEAAVRYLEDCPLFNAGRGSVFTHDGRIEMDAAVMDGATREAGAITGITTVRNPIALARAVLERSPFVMLAGEGAEAFASATGIPRAEPEYFRTEERWQQLQTQRQREQDDSELKMSLSEDNKFGTVGAVAVDRLGNVAAATSTGGMTNKRFGRIGDSPVIGAGTWADNATCAVSATGHGEFFIRYAAAHDIAARMAYGGRSVSEAAHEVVVERLKSAGGAGGVIAIDAHGNAALPFNTSGMYRGYITADGEVTVAIYADTD
jgi:beta-aspartyl-peptidase (threonine type)